MPPSHHNSFVSKILPLTPLNSKILTLVPPYPADSIHKIFPANLSLYPIANCYNRDIATKTNAAERPAATSPARSSSVNVSYSPREPFGMIPATPSSTSQEQCSLYRSKSTEPSARSGVVVAA